MSVQILAKEQTLNVDHEQHAAAPSGQRTHPELAHDTA